MLIAIIIHWRITRDGMSVLSFWVKFFPELARFPDDVDRMAALHRATTRLYLRNPKCVAFMLFVIAFSLVWAWVWPSQPANFFRHALLLASALIIPLAFNAPLFLFRGVLQGYLRNELLKRDIPICRRCGYDLTDLTSKRCPECGGPEEMQFF